MPAGITTYPRGFNLGGFTSHLPISWGPASSFSNLENLSLFGYNLIGTLPEQWGCSSCFPKLRILQLAGSTNLTGTLPTTWSLPGSFSQIVVLNLAVAALNGSIPAAWVSANAFPSLTYLSYANTTLTGPIPSFNNSQLAVLGLSFSTLSGNIADLWSSNATTISAIGLTSVNISGSFPEWFPRFWSSLQVLIVDNTSINGTIPTSWLQLADVTSTEFHSQMHNVTFSGAYLWFHSINNTAWWQDMCSSLSKTVGYVFTAIDGNPSHTYLGIQPLSSPGLDVTAAYEEVLPLLPNNAPTSINLTSAYLNYYDELQEWGGNDFGLQGPYAPTRGVEHWLPAPPCHRPSRVIPVVATWSVFGALLLTLIAGYVIWRLMSKRSCCTTCAAASFSGTYPEVFTVLLEACAFAWLSSLLVRFDFRHRGCTNCVGLAKLVWKGCSCYHSGSLRCEGNSSDFSCEQIYGRRPLAFPRCRLA